MQRRYELPKNRSNEEMSWSRAGGREIIIDRSEIEVQYGAEGGNNLGQREEGAGLLETTTTCCCLVAVANPQVH